MPKVYLRVIGPNSFEWVNNLKEATAENEKSAKVTLTQLRSAELVEVPQPRGDPSKWVICCG